MQLLHMRTVNSNNNTEAIFTIMLIVAVASSSSRITVAAAAAATTTMRRCADGHHNHRHQYDVGTTMAFTSSCLLRNNIGCGSSRGITICRHGRVAPHCHRHRIASFLVSTSAPPSCISNMAFSTTTTRLFHQDSRSTTTTTDTDDDTDCIPSSTTILAEDKDYNHQQHCLSKVDGNDGTTTTTSDGDESATVATISSHSSTSETWQNPRSRWAKRKHRIKMEKQLREGNTIEGGNDGVVNDSNNGALDWETFEFGTRSVVFLSPTFSLYALILFDISPILRPLK